jgi:hypothetical protein
MGTCDWGYIMPAGWVVKVATGIVIFDDIYW